MITKAAVSKRLPAPTSAEPSLSTVSVLWIHRKACLSLCRRTAIRTGTAIQNTAISLTAEARTELNEKVIDAYEQAVQAQGQQDEAAEESETQGMAPSM